MSVEVRDPLRVAVVCWKPDDGIALVIGDELRNLGYKLSFIDPNHKQIADVDFIFSFGPYGRFLKVPQLYSQVPPQDRPIMIHWNTEGIPDLRMPWSLVRFLSKLRSKYERLVESERSFLGKLLRQRPLSLLRTRFIRYLYVGDYYYAYNNGWLDVFSDSSSIYAKLHNQNNKLPTVVAAWGGTQRWYKGMSLERDIDVLWIGKRGSMRRSQLVDYVRDELKKHNVNMYIADGEENPFIFGDERTEYLNRSKITLNITRTWYDDNYSRFSMAAPNRSLVVSEPLLPHCEEYKEGVHYVSAPIEELPERILHYLKNEDAREQIVENAYQLITNELSFKKQIDKIMQVALRKREEKRTAIKSK
ncbi:MAG: glycosyltransferase [Chloroflexota bacterium]